ncbi:bifunctional alpha/beta hydrolase/OsmC family protein [Kordiimonas sp. SCSIO 12610]|uniref:bifunctional alpha/beta hydrolase/OsmC family protein n=1 Tax=Kordiimonas sp. SCSIO 12610 TaxID=2829597 RepID=UPI00210B1D2E|nr:bifunctional alpha/beta hydrolase/OsmC family protein [Kordiimonas sp. SCSIO 12610]UTW56086.1 alpha/beta fold hydrolase [Kordiimonas sp. SCSIO 12610]
MERITFMGSQGFELAARLDRPVGPIKAYALFAHCFTCGKDLAPANRIVKALNNDGIAVLRFDFTGLGKSGGEFENTNFSSNVADLVVAANHMRDHFEAPSLMIGHSLGGTATLLAALEVPEVKAVATLGSPSNATNVMKQFAGDVDTIESTGEADVKLAGRPFKIKKQFLDDIKDQNVLDAVAKLKKPLLIAHSPIDDTVSVDHAAEIFMAAKHPKSFLSLDKGDHLLFNPGTAEYVAKSIAAWASAYIPDLTEEDMINIPYGRVAVHPTGYGKFQQHVHAGPHNFLADEPKAYGGDETGATPYNLLLAGLGACTSMTIKMYADRKGIELDDVEIYLDHKKIHAQDCDTCETETGKLDKIERQIVLKGNLSDAERARLIEIADRCPVHRTLHSEVVITTEERAEEAAGTAA